jgi:hypothetical protein
MIRDIHSLSDQAARTDNTKAPYLSIVENGGIHADEDIASDAATIENGAVTDEHAISDENMTLM